MKPPKVTVIIPTCNRAHYLGEAIQSVLDQTFEDFELIVVDDGSTDATRHLVQRFNDARIRYLYQAHNGISAAMNTGIRTARGSYIARLDSDDVWLSELLAVEVEVLDARPGVGLVYARVQGMDRDGAPLPQMRGSSPRYPGETFKSMLHHDFTCNITITARRACFDRVGLYDEDLNTSEDWDMWLRVARHYEFACVDRVLARYRIHEGSITSSASPHFTDFLENRSRVLDKMFGQPDLPASVLAMKSVCYRNVYMWTGLLWFNGRDFRRACRWFWRAVRIDDRPVITAIRIVWHILIWEFLSRYAWSRRFFAWQDALFHRWRTRKLTR